MALNYLLSPEFQIVNSAGKPATGGYLEVYIHGSRTRYYCASDFDGTLHPFQVPLDSLGGNVVLADDSNAYDVYIFNRYGSLLMSRYNVHPSSGGFGGLITSSDGTITVTQIDGGWDLSVTGGKAGTLKAGGDALSSDGYFSFRKLEGEGDAIYMDNQGHIFLEDGWYHFSATVKLNWNGVEQPHCGPIRLSSGFTYDIIDFDFSYNHVDTVVLDGDIYIAPRSSQYISFGRGFTLSIMGMQLGMTAELVDCDIHTILGQGGTMYSAGEGIEIDSGVISVDTSVVATQADLEGKQDVLTAGDNITIEDNVISATAAPQEQADWTESDTESVSYIKHKPTELPAAIDNGVELIAGQNITLTNTLAGLVISASGGGGGGGSTPWTYSEDTAFDITVTASDAFSSYFERLVPITSQAVLTSGKDFGMIYQCQVEADSTNPPNIPDMTPIMVNVYNYPNYLIDELTGVFTNLGGSSRQKFASHGSVVISRQMLADGRVFSVFFPQGTLTEGDKFKLIVRAIYIELTGVNE